MIEDVPSVESVLCCDITWCHERLLAYDANITVRLDRAV